MEPASRRCKEGEPTVLFVNQICTLGILANSLLTQFGITLPPVSSRVGPYRLRVLLAIVALSGSQSHRCGLPLPIPSKRAQQASFSLAIRQL